MRMQIILSVTRNLDVTVLIPLSPTPSVGLKKKKGLLSQQYQKEKAHNFKSLSVQAQKKVMQQQDQDLCIHMTLT